jgi:uncharacterized protein with von Willebrand factor type A (vWA) domain
VADRLLANLLMFARTLRAAGVGVRPGGVPDAIRALTEVGVSSRRDVRDALRAVLISRHEDVPLFDEVFERFWRAWGGPSDREMPRPMGIPARARTTLTLLASGAGASEPERIDSANSDVPIGLPTYSADEIWRRKDFAAFTTDDIARAQKAIETLTWRPGLRVTRRWVAGGRRTVDLRRVLRASAKHGGELVTVPYRMRRVVPRPVVLICDVSGSMEPYARMLLLFAHALSGSHRRIEVFVFSTELTRVTRQFAGPQAGAALLRVRDAVRDWSGGTRIGAALHRFNTDWARRVLRRGPVVLLISDGWDLGDPQFLGREVARLQRSVRRLIWLNPLIGSPGYEPLTRGIRAALPFVDDFLSVRDMSSLEALARHLNTLE